MPITPVNGSTIIRDTLFFLKNFLSGVISDPISSRPANQSFIMTSYPTRPVTYPLITIKDLNMVGGPILGFQSQAVMTHPEIEVRVWGNTIAQRDQISDQVFQNLRNNQIGTGSTSQSFNLHDFKLLNAVNVTEENDGPKSKVQHYSYMFVAT